MATEWDQPLQVICGALEVGLHRDTKVPVLVLNRSIQIDRGPGPFGLLHVDRYGRAYLRSSRGKLAERSSRPFQVDPHPQLGQLDRNVRIEAFRGNPVQDREVILLRSLRRD